jgi:protein involved in polysaccharide export with SLBB domain/capsular polysaccharide biosynthesis protein
MNEKPDSNAGSSRPRDDAETIRGDTAHANGHANGNSSSPPFSIWTFADLIANRWHWLVVGIILGCGGFFLLGWKMVQPKFTANVQFLRYETPAQSDLLKTQPLTSETFAGLIVSPDLLKRVGDKIQPPIPPERLAKQMKVDPQAESDIVKVSVAAGDAQQAVDLANVYAQEVVAYTKELQASQAWTVANNYLKKQVDAMDRDITSLQDEFRGSRSGGLTNKLAKVSGDLSNLHQNLAGSGRPNTATLKLMSKLQDLRLELGELTAKYTDEHPAVISERARISELQRQISESQTNSEFAGSLDSAAALPGQPVTPEHEIILTKLRSLEDASLQMANHEREAELYANNPPGVVRVFAPANIRTVQSGHRRIKTAVVTIFGGCLGFVAAFGFLLLVEFFDSRLKTADDVKRVTRLPVLTVLGDLNEMKNGSREQWAFRAWTMLQGRLSRSQNHGLVCGITSSSEGEGRSTWINLLAEAASLSGFRVLTIATRPSPTASVGALDEINEETLNHAEEMKTPEETDPSSALATNNVLTAPSQVTDQLTGPNSSPVVHIPLPGWVWNLERRKQWRSALNHWRQIDNLVILVELPPASVPEAVLLGSNLPNLVWLTESGAADAGETRTQLETLRHARCNLVGAVLNRATLPEVKRCFPRWLTCLAFIAALGLGTVRAQTNGDIFTPAPVPAKPEAGGQTTEVRGEMPAAGSQTPEAGGQMPEAGSQTPDAGGQPVGTTVEPPPLAEANTNLSFSVVHSSRAHWQEHLTLGPGDILTFGLYGDPLATRQDVTIGPDGRVSFLEAHDILATGLTIDDLRARLDQELGKYIRSPRTIIMPVAFHSKKYYMLGKVMRRGVYILDRPITVVEAIARAQGLENGVVENNTLDLADLQHSFLMRNGKRMPLDFEKLFQSGDLSQNIQIEPNDYLYFPSDNVRQVFVLGEVALPGPVTFRPDMTVVAALSGRGGFNEKSFKTRVLVLRGSLNHPETFVVNTMDIFHGKAPDFRLREKDIIYVSHRPWYRVEDLLDLATTAFIQSLVTGWTGQQIFN